MKKRREVVIEIGRQVVQIQVQLVFLPSTQDIREIKQQRRWRLRKRHLKVNSRCLKLFRAYFISFNTSNVGKSGKESGKEKESCCLVFPSSTKRENRHFHIVVLQQRLRNVQRRVVRVQSCCFSNLNLLPYSLPSPSSLLKLPIVSNGCNIVVAPSLQRCVALKIVVANRPV